MLRRRLPQLDYLQMEPTEGKAKVVFQRIAEGVALSSAFLPLKATHDPSILSTSGNDDNPIHDVDCLLTSGKRKPKPKSCRTLISATVPSGHQPERKIAPIGDLNSINTASNKREAKGSTVDRQSSTVPKSLDTVSVDPPEFMKDPYYKTQDETLRRLTNTADTLKSTKRETGLRSTASPITTIATMIPAKESDAVTLQQLCSNPSPNESLLRHKRSLDYHATANEDTFSHFNQRDLREIGKLAVSENANVSSHVLEDNFGNEFNCYWIDSFAGIRGVKVGGHLVPVKVTPYRGTFKFEMTSLDELEKGKSNLKKTEYGSLDEALPGKVDCLPKVMQLEDLTRYSRELINVNGEFRPLRSPYFLRLKKEEEKLLKQAIEKLDIQPSKVYRGRLSPPIERRGVWTSDRGYQYVRMENGEVYRVAICEDFSGDCSGGKRLMPKNDLDVVEEEERKRFNSRDMFDCERMDGMCTRMSMCESTMREVAKKRMQEEVEDDERLEKTSQSKTLYDVERQFTQNASN